MNTGVSRVLTRRRFLSQVAGVSALAASPFSLGNPLREHLLTLSQRGKAVILLWMGGGPSTIDLWDLKPGTACGGPFRPIRTSGEGQICEHLPLLARQMHHFSVIRSMSTRETDHVQGRCLMRNGGVPNSVGDSCDGHTGAADERIVAWTAREIPCPQREEPATIGQQYGEHPFGRRCLLARQLVEQGVPLVTVDFDGWDNHHNIFRTLRDRQLPVLDRAMSALVEDLSQRGLLGETVILWLGEFSRTPRVNHDAGRDHWARAWSVVIGGAGIAGGTVVGKTTPDGTRVLGEAHSAADLWATAGRALGISRRDTECLACRETTRQLGDHGTPIAEALA